MKKSLSLLVLLCIFCPSLFSGIFVILTGSEHVSYKFEVENEQGERHLVDPHTELYDNATSEHHRYGERYAHSFRFDDEEKVRVVEILLDRIKTTDWLVLDPKKTYVAKEKMCDSLILKDKNGNRPIPFHYEKNYKYLYHKYEH